MAMETKVLAVFIVFSFLVGSSEQHFDESSDEPANSTSVVVRRRTALRLASGSNRLALMNSRFSRRPRKKNLDPDQLLEILGEFYDPNWMSIEEPVKDPETFLLREDAWPYQQLSKALHQLNLSQELGKAGLDAVSLFEKWLMKKGSCPVKYTWEDIGTMFWPRWIRIGECSSAPGTCSWPPGMHCVVTGRSNLHILRWQCRTPKTKRRKLHKGLQKKEWSKRPELDPLLLKCQWVRVPYPITNACHCTC